MAKLTLGDNTYETDDFSEEARAQLVSYMFAEKELKRINAQVAVFETAKNAYAKALKDILDDSSYKM